MCSLEKFKKINKRAVSNKSVHAGKIQEKNKRACTFIRYFRVCNGYKNSKIGD